MGAPMQRVSDALLRGAFGHRWFCRPCGTLHLLPNHHLCDGFYAEPTFAGAFEHHDEDGHFCRYYIVGGKVQYDLNCTHYWAGKTVQLPPLPKEYDDAAAGRPPAVP